VSQEEVVVISAVRSPFGKFGGSLKDFTLPKLGGVVVAEAIRRAGVAPQDVEEVATGVNLPGSDGPGVLFFHGRGQYGFPLHSAA